MVTYNLRCPSQVFNRKLPCSVKVDILNLVVAPLGVDRGAETPVLGLFQSSEAVYVETLKTRLGGFQNCHVLHTTVNHWDPCVGQSQGV